jgi:hypothetical protein
MGAHERIKQDEAQAVESQVESDRAGAECPREVQVTE